jgi:hypothetical protein
VTKRLPCPPAPGPLEDYATQFDPLFARLAQRRGLRAYLQGLLLPRDRNKTMTALAGAEPIVGAQHAAVQGLQWFLTESSWDHERVNQRRVQLLLDDPATAPHDQGVLGLDDTGDRKAGRHTAHVARQYLGSLGKTDNGIVAVTSLWADARVYWPIDVVPYTPASRLPKGKRDPAFRTKPQLAVALVNAAQNAGIGFRAVVADCFYGDNTGFTEALGRAGVAYVLAVKPRKGVWAPAEEAHTPARLPPSSSGPALSNPAIGPRSPGGSVTATPRPGGRPTLRCRRPAGATAAPAAGGGDYRPGEVAEADHLVPGHQPAPSRPAGGSGLRVGRPGRGGAPVQPAQLGRAGLQAGQRGSWAGPTSRSARIGRSAGTGSWCAARSRSAGGPGSPSRQHRRHRMPSPPRRARGGRPPISSASMPGGVVAWPVALRRVRGWLTPWVVLGRCWRAWSPAAPPLQLRLLLDAAHAGRPLHLYLPP